MKNIIIITLFIGLLLILSGKVLADSHRLEVLDTLNIHDKNGNPAYSYEVMHDKKTNVYCYIIGVGGLVSNNASMQCLQIK